MNPTRFTAASTWRSPGCSPRIPDHTLARYPGAVRAPEQHTGVELTRLLTMLQLVGADTIAIGHGRDRASVTAARALHAAWTTAGGTVAAVVDWPATAASWLRPARRLTPGDPDAWVLADTIAGCAQVVRRLAEQTNWTPVRTVGFAGLAGPDLVTLTEPISLAGMAGPTATGGERGASDPTTPSAPTNRTAPMTLFGPTYPDRERRIIAPGAIHLPDWLDHTQQRRLVEAFRAWSTGPVPIRTASLPGGRRMTVHTVCLGWHWQPYRYTRTADDVNGHPVLPFPQWLGDIGRAVIHAAYGPGVDYRPDTALVNHHDADARLGMHQDKDETVDEPVVSLSVGDTCRFRFGKLPHPGQAPHRPRPRLRRRLRVRPRIPLRLPRRPQDSPRDRRTRMRTRPRPHQHHHAGHRPRLTASSPSRISYCRSAHVLAAAIVYKVRRLERAPDRWTQEGHTPMSVEENKAIVGRWFTEF